MKFNCVSTNYDAAGTRIYEMNTLRNISKDSITYQPDDGLLRIGSTTYDYDDNGFLRKKTDTSVTEYDYSPQGELTGVSLPDGRSIGYVHDPLGRRIAKTVDNVVVEKYLWQGMTRLLAVYNGADTLLMRFEYADARMPFAMTKDGATYFLAYDQVGSLRVVTDASGNPVKRIGYDSFGNVFYDSDPDFPVPFGFAGGLHDRDTGLVRFGYRDYDPDTGRWTAKDPIGFAGGDSDLYGYCLGDPVNWSDPEGLSKTEGILQGEDEYRIRLKEAQGDRPEIDKIEREAKKKQNCREFKPDRWKKIIAWIKLAKDGRLYEYPILILPGQEDIIKGQDPKNWDPNLPYDRMTNPGGSL